MDNNHLFFKFMHDIIDSGLWGSLSATARTLYPVLCRFSNESFKAVWPGTNELLRLTGFKTKKSLQLARKELIDAGLIDVITGNGRTSSKYYFKFDYESSKIDLDKYRDTVVSLRGSKSSPPGDAQSPPRGITEVTPNNINININTNNEKQEVFYKNIETLFKEFLGIGHNKFSSKEHIINTMLEKYGELEIGEAIKIAIKRGKNGDIQYLEGILKNRNKSTNYNQNENIKDIKQIGTEKIILNKLNDKFDKINLLLEYYYYYNNTYYFKSKENINTYDIEKYAKEIGFNVKILISSQIIHSVKSEIKFMNQN
ncbi:MAG: helix-turn-helix domain-containing protein [Spirochaetia bacterium]|nr:helix-turn-helix domain-containing protein [Spirochaetia bacterium]